MDNLLEQEYFDNRVLDYLIMAGIILVGLVVVRVLKGIVLSRLKTWAARTETKADDFLIKSTERFGIPALLYFIIYSAVTYLTLSPKVEKIVGIVTSIVITYLMIRLVSTTLLHLLQSYIRKQERGEEKVKQIGGLILLINIVIWVLGIVFLMDNLGYDVTALLAGLGIGGIAIALAAQNILGDLFNYFVIFFDRPFEVGDFIIVDDKLGTIEYIGLKTTRIRALSGEQLVIGNANLTASRIHNYKRLARRRAVFTFEVQYGTPVELLREIPTLVKSIIEQQELTAFDRAHFKAYNTSSLQFETVYYIDHPDMTRFMDIQQSINLAIYEAFLQRGIKFAIPAQSVFLNPNEKLQESLDIFVGSQRKP